MLSGLINVGESSVAIASIRTDGGTQPREGLDHPYITELAELLGNGVTLPPVDVMYDGKDYWLYDGFHRLEAHKAINRVMISARVHQGDQTAAQWESYAANQGHGLRRSPGDKERAIRAALKHPNGAKMSDSLIGKHLGVSNKTVTRYREIMESAWEIPKLTERQGADGKVYNTANIGTNQPTRTKAPIRHDSTLPALQMPAPGAVAASMAAKIPIEDWELEDIVEQAATEYYGKVTRMVGDSMMLAAQAQAGDYWAKLRRVLEAFDVTAERIEAAVAATVERLVGERRALRPGSPEAKALGKEIKSATWGDQPLKQPARFAEVWELERTLAQWAQPLHATVLRSTANMRSGGMWWQARQALQALGTLNYRDRDLVSALHNLASQKEPAAKPVEVEELDPWVAAWKVRPYDSMIKQADRLVVQLEPWAQAWTDDKGRTWRDVVGRNPQHANSPFRQDLEAACRQRGLVLTGEEMAETIRILFVRLQLDAPTAESGREAEGETQGGKLLTEWTDEDWAAYAQKEADDAQVLPMHVAEFEMPDDLIDVWSPRIVDGGVYLVDVVRNRSTETVALDDLDELFAQARRMDGALDLVVDGDQPLPGWVDADAEQRAIDAAKRIAEATPAGWTAAPVSHREGYDSDEWYTPGWVLQSALAVMGQIDLDPASCELAQEVVQAGLYWTKKQDGCHMTWFGRVWLNPPYSAPGAFVDKLLDEYMAGNVQQACVLLNNATETRWFQRLLARFPVCFFSQRLAFWRHDHEDVGARQGQALFYLGADVEKFVEVFGEHGIVVKRLD